MNKQFMEVVPPIIIIKEPVVVIVIITSVLDTIAIAEPISLRGDNK